MTQDPKDRAPASPQDLADMISDGQPEMSGVLENLPDRSAAEVIEELPFDVYRRVLKSLTKDKIARVLNEMEPDEAADVLAVLSDDERQKILSRVDKDHRKTIETLEKYHPESAGGIMTTEFLAVGPEIAAKELIPRINLERDAETINAIYVIDKAGQLLGVASIREILTHPPDAAIGSFMTRQVVSCRTDTDQEQVARLVDKYNLHALPVVDAKGILVGIITVDDVIDVIQEEATEDFSKLAGTPTKHPLTESVSRRVWARLPWMLTTLVLGLMTALYLSIFDGAMALFAGMTSMFMPVLAGMGGNVGIQSSTIIVRGLATGEIRERRARDVIWKEVVTGSSLGALCGGFSGVFTAILTPALVPRVPKIFGFVVGASMMLGMTVSAASGASIPFVFRWLGKDPALASGPFVTTINDVIGLTVYFSLTTALSGWFV